MTFEEALQAMRDGKKVSRPGWQDDFYWDKDVLDGKNFYENTDVSYDLEWQDLLAIDWEIFHDS